MAYVKPHTRVERDGTETAVKGHVRKVPTKTARIPQQRSNPNPAAAARPRYPTPDASVREVSHTVVAERFHRTNLDWPQANEVEKISATTVLCATEGTFSGNDIAHALGVVDRQGQYYATATESLGLLQRCDTTPVSWEPTELGELYAEASPAEQCAMLKELIEEHPAVVSLRSGEDVAFERAVADGLSEDTAQRRIATAQTWLSTAAQLDGATLSTEWQSVAGRLPEVLARVKQRAVHTPKLTEICGGCFLEKTASGGCDC